MKWCKNSTAFVGPCVHASVSDYRCAYRKARRFSANKRPNGSDIRRRIVMICEHIRKYNKSQKNGGKRKPSFLTIDRGWHFPNPGFWIMLCVGEATQSKWGDTPFVERKVAKRHFLSIAILLTPTDSTYRWIREFTSKALQEVLQQWNLQWTWEQKYELLRINSPLRSPFILIYQCDIRIRHSHESKPQIPIPIGHFAT